MEKQNVEHKQVEVSEVGKQELIVEKKITNAVIKKELKKGSKSDLIDLVLSLGVMVDNVKQHVEEIEKVVDNAHSMGAINGIVKDEIKLLVNSALGVQNV